MSRGLWLSETQMAEIRKLLADGKLYHRQIAERFCVDRSVISRIAQGKRKKPGVCLCQKCAKCRNREYSAQYRERRDSAAAQRDFERIDAQIARENAA